MKKIILFVCVIFIGVSVFAQENVKVKDTTKVEAPVSKFKMNQFKHNWDISVMIGTNAFLGEYVFHYKSILHPFTIPYVDVNVQKWLTPVWSIGMGLSFAKFKSLYYYKKEQYNYFTDLEHDKPYSGDPDYYVSTGSMVGIYIKTSCDVATMIGGYRENRIFHPVIYAGGGLLVPMNKMEYRPIGVMFLAGLMFNFQITPHFLLGFDMEGNFIGDNFDGRFSGPGSIDPMNLRVDANQKFAINFTYRFGFVKTKNPVTGAEERHPWVPVEQNAVDASMLNQELAQAKQAAAQAQSELEKANAAIAEAQKEAKEASAAGAAATAASQSAREDTLQSQIERLKLQLMQAQDDLASAREAADKAQLALQTAVNTNTATVEKDHSKEVIFRRDTVSYWQIVTFPIDKWVITNRERVNIMAAADMIKATPGVNYVLTGYADSQTATAERNWFLSEKRANAVLKVLVEEYGIPAERLSIDFKGGVENLYFHDVECSRSVVISPARK